MIYINWTITLLAFYGWNNPSTCVFEYYDSSFGGDGKNFSLTLFPLRFWDHFYFDFFELGANNKRLIIGIGLISFFIDF